MDKLSFFGRGSLDAGTYGEISIAGSGKITGDIICEKLDASGSIHGDGNIDCTGSVSSSGSFRCLGNLKSKSFDGSGSADIHGNIEISDEFDCSGTVHVGGNFAGGQMDCSGSVQVGGSITSGSVDISGSLRVGQDLKGTAVEASGRMDVGADCEVETFTSSGMVTIAGLLNADRIEIRLGGRDSKIKELGGEQIVVRRSDSSTFFGMIRSSLGNGVLITDSIEGNDISLENTRAKIVRGSKLNIGSGCEIDQVEYSGTCVVDAEAKVGEKRQV